MFHIVRHKKGEVSEYVSFLLKSLLNMIQLTIYTQSSAIKKKITSEILIHRNVFVFFVCLFFARELCEESMAHSASSASSLDSHAPSESSSQSQGIRWEEQQKVLALEQLCGVFRVDLGHMRSLRLFFRSAGKS